MITVVQAHITDTGAWVPVRLPQPDDNRLTSEPCPWCDGQGVAGGGCDDEELHFNPDLLMTACQRCNGSGKIGTLTRGELRQRQWDEMVWMTDARRAERSYGGGHGGYCPDCGVYDCTGGGEYTCPQAPDRRYMVDAITGEEVPVLRVRIS